MLEQGVPVSVIPVGRKGRDFMVRSSNDVRAVFVDMGDRPSQLDTLPISRLAIEDYESGYADEVYVFLLPLRVHRSAASHHTEAAPG